MQDPRTHYKTPSAPERGAWGSLVVFLDPRVRWTLFGMYVLSYRVGSLGAVTALLGVAFLYGDVTELAAASWVRSGQWLFIVGGIVGWQADPRPQLGRPALVEVCWSVLARLGGGEKSVSSCVTRSAAS